MSSSFFLSNSTGGNKMKGIGSKRKLEGHKKTFGKPKVKKKKIDFNSNDALDCKYFSLNLLILFIIYNS